MPLRADPSIENSTWLRTATAELLDLLCNPVLLVKLRRIFTLLVQIHCRSASNYGDVYQDMLNCYTYDPDDPEDGGIRIRPVHTFRETDAEQDPAIYVALRNTIYRKVAIDDFAATSQDMATDYSEKLTQTQLRYIITLPDADHSIAMGESLAALIQALRHPLMRRMDLHSLDLVELSEVSQKSESPAKFARVDVAFNLQFSHGTALTTESHLLKRVALKLTSAAGNGG